jgi:hypothetical protein
MTVEVLNSKKGLMDNISPTGVKYKIVPVPTGHSLFKIVSDQVGPVPMDLQGTYTSAKNAQIRLTGFLVDRWHESDQVSSGKKSNKVA